MSKRKPSSESIIRVGIADKSPLIQAALTHLFTKDERFELVKVWAGGESFLKSVDQYDLHVAVTGWVISPGDGRYILDHLRAREHAPRIIVYTGAEGESVPAQVMAHGGAAFVSKSEQPEVLLDTVATVAKGRMVFPFLDVRQIHRNPLTSLTKRELEVLSALAAGQTNKEIASAQGVSPNTVKFHVKNLFDKLGVHNRSKAIALYLKS